MQGGGAFKVINSWGTNWGEKGYFWLPYEFLWTPVKIDGEPQGSLLAGMFVLLDDNNPQSVYAANTPPTVSAELPKDLPNLAVKMWNISYDKAQPGGKGELSYSVANIGTQATTGIMSVTLALFSSNKQPNAMTCDPTDWDENPHFYTIAAEGFNQFMPIELKPNEEFRRDKTMLNVLPFEFPSLETSEVQIRSGTYCLQLQFRAFDDNGVILEQTQDDNVSTAANTITFYNPLPDIAVNYFYVEWDSQTGDAKLDYSMVNQGGSPVPASEWTIFLALERVVNGGEDVFDLWRSKTKEEELAPLANRDPKSRPVPFFVAPERAITFNMYKDGQSPQQPGEYYLWFKVIAGDYSQSDYQNDESYGDFVTIPDPNQNRSGTRDTTLLRAYNGKGLSSRLGTNRKMRIRKLPDGQQRLERVEEEVPRHKFDKEIHSRDQVIWPTENIIYLPPVKEE